jgi:hypothetical protein
MADRKGSKTGHRHRVACPEATRASLAADHA